MTANIAKGGTTGRMFYSFKQPAWHSMGKISMINTRAEQVLIEDFQGGFTTETRPVVVNLNGVLEETGDYAIVRSPMGGDPESKELVFGYVSEKYQPLQPIDLARCFDENTGKYVETMGFLGNGNDMFISWEMPEFEITPGDLVKLYGIVRSGFDSMKGTSLFTSTYRPVCQNTITLAQNWARRNTDGKGRGDIWSGKHNNKNLLRDLGYWMKYVVSQSEREADDTKSFFSALANTPVKSDKHVSEILWLAFPDPEKLGSYYAPELRGKKEAEIEESAGKAKAIREGIYSLFSGQGTAITPNLWGVMNSTSEYFCHYLPSKKPVASSVMFGNRQSQIMSMVNVLKQEIAFAG